MISGIVGAVKLGRDKERRDRRRARKEELAAKKKLGLLRESAGIPGNRTPALRESGFSAVDELRLLNTRLREDVFEVIVRFDNWSDYLMASFVQSPREYFV